VEWGVVAIIVVAVIVLGSRLPQIARNVGKAQTEFKKGLKEGAAEDAAPTTPTSPPPATAPPPAAAPPPSTGPSVPDANPGEPPSPTP
jgi:sec-independent protein translocase protein TatA